MNVYEEKEENIKKKQGKKEMGGEINYMEK